jgi:peroxiredoxin
MMTPQQAFRVFGYASNAMVVVGLVAAAISVGWGIYALFRKDKGQRRRTLRTSLLSFLVFAMFSGTQLSAMIVFVNDHWTPLLMVLFALPMVVMLAGLIASVVYGTRALLRRTGTERRQTVLKSLLGVVVFGVGMAPHTAAMLMMTAVEDHSNHAGTFTNIGDPAPDFELATLEGTPFHLADLHGRVIVLNFFATWCGPCQMELPHLQALWDEFRGNGDFRMLVVGSKESDRSVKAFRQEHGFSFPMAADPGRSAYHKFATQYIPRTYLVSRQGTIVYQWTGHYEAEIAKLRKLLRKELAKND